MFIDISYMLGTGDKQKKNVSKRRCIIAAVWYLAGWCSTGG